MLCSRHSAEWMAWLDYKLPPEPIAANQFELGKEYLVTFTLAE